jgi:hypothetical protein
MRLRSGRIVGVLLVAGLVAVAAGCGGGSKSNSPGTTHSSTVTRTQATTTSGGSSAVASFANAHNCQALAGIAAKAAAAVQASGNANNALQTEAAEMQALAKAAPSEISGDFQTFAAAFAGFLHALQNAGYKLGSKTPPTAAQAAAFAAAVKSFDTTKVKQAEQHLTAWGRQNCKGLGG